MGPYSYILCICCDILQGEWANFVHISYQDQVPGLADACKISIGSMPNCNNHGNIFLKF